VIVQGQKLEKKPLKLFVHPNRLKESKGKVIHVLN